MYYADVLQLIGKNAAGLIQQGEYVNIRLWDLLNQKDAADERSAEEIARDVLSKAGLEVIDK